jgi:hypothetical protein
VGRGGPAGAARGTRWSIPSLRQVEPSERPIVGRRTADVGGSTHTARIHRENHGRPGRARTATRLGAKGLASHQVGNRTSLCQFSWHLSPATCEEFGPVDGGNGVCTALGSAARFRCAGTRDRARITVGTAIPTLTSRMSLIYPHCAGGRPVATFPFTTSQESLSWSGSRVGARQHRGLVAHEEPIR